MVDRIWIYLVLICAKRWFESKYRNKNWLETSHIGLSTFEVKKFVTLSDWLQSFVWMTSRRIASDFIAHVKCAFYVPNQRRHVPRRVFTWQNRCMRHFASIVVRNSFATNRMNNVLFASKNTEKCVINSWSLVYCRIITLLVSLCLQNLYHNFYKM